ncbi:hypothetical protein CBP31_14630 [Oceanisphaera profunda]|uniref:Uncharacterized protein n=1 Tax=Oceanisphaera profunda TaxID=1416627 RepID=A0A1Y0D950_9GAMM|nr:hypothetical protein [Oceanisphaera profunda]ART83717.1 hypothetical protein CBP31_14630 [Oceanisphaera profunda]
MLQPRSHEHLYGRDHTPIVAQIVAQSAVITKLTRVLMLEAIGLAVNKAVKPYAFPSLDLLMALF